MKKTLALFLLAALLLTGCAQTPSGVYEADGLRLTVDWEQCQISDGQYVYNYTHEETGNGDQIIITYPNGAQYCVNGKDGKTLVVSAYQAGNISDYISPETLYTALNDQKPVTPKVFQGFSGLDILILFLGICIIAVGILFMVFPGRWKWKIRIGKGHFMRVTITRGEIIVVSGILLIAYTIFSAFR